MVNFGPFAADIGWWVWITPANFNGCCMLASLLHWHCSMDVNQTLHDVWPSPGLLPPEGILPARCKNSKIHFAFKSSALLCWQRYCTALEQWAYAKLCDVVQGMELRNFYRGCHLYSAGQPSRWAWAHILVLTVAASVCELHYKLS